MQFSDQMLKHCVSQSCIMCRPLYLPRSCDMIMYVQRPSLCTFLRHPFTLFLLGEKYYPILKCPLLMCHFYFITSVRGTFRKFKGKFKVKGKGRAVSVHTKKLYKGCGVTATRVLITSAIDKGAWSNSHIGRIISRKIMPGTFN